MSAPENEVPEIDEQTASEFEPASVTDEPDFEIGEVIHVAYRPILSVINPDDLTTVYERTLKNGHSFILLTPGRNPDGQGFVLVEAGGGMDPIQVAHLMGNAANSIHQFFLAMLQPPLPFTPAEGIIEDIVLDEMLPTEDEE